MHICDQISALARACGMLSASGFGISDALDAFSTYLIAGVMVAQLLALAALAVAERAFLRALCRAGAHGAASSWRFLVRAIIEALALHALAHHPGGTGMRDLGLLAARWRDQA